MCVCASTATHACFKSACGKRQWLIRQLLLCDTKGVWEKSLCNSMLAFEEKRFHVLICDAGTTTWRNKRWFMELYFKNSSLQVCTRATKLAQLPWMTYWRTRSSPQSVSAVIIIWDCSVEMIWSTALFCFLLVSFCDWIQTLFKLGGENQGVFNYGAIWGWLCCALVAVPVFFLQKCGGEDGLLLINRLWRWRSNLISHFNINAIGSFKVFHLNLHKAF